MPFHTRSHTTLHASDLFPGINKFISIKFNVLKLDTAQKVYSVNKGLFLGVLFSPWFAYLGRYRLAIYRALVNHAEIFFDLRYLLATKTDATVHSYYYSFNTWHAPLVIDFLYLMECCGCTLIVLWHQNVWQGCTVSWLLLWSNR